MCGACGAASAGTASMHWSTPFLGSVPARTAAARNLTAWARRAGSSSTVTGVASGFQVATASGGRRLFGDLGAVVGQLAGSGPERRTALAGAASLDQVAEGPPTLPAERLAAASAGRAATDRWSEGRPVPLPAAVRRRYRVPALLAWLAAADGASLLGTLALRLDLGSGTGLALWVTDGAVTDCRAGRTTGPDRLLTPDGSAPPGLLALLG